ncbi:viral a-type inclusion protein [Sporothrix schenckii 1099-18]|uniref:Viral a-type inclusion protein n=1 Tax=Sporothrix schenckii 1099-18 TaxID=1397361 RepID=A0A0F2LVX9_SPOSC|nr:viral a-type inclusion protein [Sporothrix schenckii 1099-18]KJR80984.1 viral a-type inclusion protein [Sporothrix schenckii 1099-18]
MRENAIADCLQRSATSHDLGLKYLEARHQEGLIVKDDDVRRHRLQVILLQDENGRLKDQVSSLGDRVASLTTQYDEAQRQLDNLNNKCHEQDDQLRAQAREHTALRTELLSLSNATNDSTKVLTEKLALSRELAVLKPEIEHLQSQLAHQKDVLSEKLALERQLNAVEVELANEKRAAQRAAAAAAQRQQTESDNNEAEEDLRRQIHDLEKKLANEKRVREKMQREQEEARSTDKDKITKAVEDEKRESLRTKKALETELAEARGQIDVFELRVGDLKSKLREVREELKSARAELAAAHDKPAAHIAAAATVKEGIKKTKSVATVPGTTTTKVQTKGQKKRRADEPSGPESLLQTPGIGDEGRTKRPLKKRGFDATAVQKSTFSITPFLNKTSNPMDESADAAAAGAAPAAADKPKASDAETSAEDKSAVDKSVSAVESMMPESTLPGEASELPEDSIMGRRVSASATLSSVDISESSSVPPTVKAAAQNVAAGAKRRGRPPKDKVLGDAPLSKKNMKVQPTAAESKPVVADEPAFTKAPIEVDKAKEAAADEPAAVEQENRPPPATSAAGGVTMKVKKSAAPVVAKVTSEAEPKKKKRKILGAGSKTVFDDDDDDDGALARPMKPAASAASAAAPAGGAGVKRVVKNLGAGRTTAVGAGKRTMLGGMRNAFGGVGGGSFSPLKRDRRGVNASFLA